MPFCANKFQFIKYTDLGGRVISSAKDMDLKEILNLMYWCDHFIRPIPQPFIKYLRDIRNRKWGRVTKLELTNYAMFKKVMPFLVQRKHCFRIWRMPCMRFRFLRANAHKNQTKSENGGKSVNTQSRSNFGYQ